MSEPVTYEALRSAFLDLLDGVTDPEDLDYFNCLGLKRCREILALRDQLMDQTGGAQ